MKIENTKNYALFQFHIEQKKHHEKKLQRLKGSMQKWGFLETKPIMVIRLASGKFKIIDGHSRFEAARQLGLGIYYVVVDKKLDEAVMDVNDWPLIDCVRRWATRGLPDYVELLRYMDYGISLMATASLLQGNLAQSANGQDRLRRGEWKVKTRDLIAVIVRFITEAGAVTPVVKSARFHDGLSACLFVPEFDADRLLRKVMLNPRMLVKVATKEQMLEQIEEIYNFKTSAGMRVPLAFMAKTASQERRVAVKKD